jgi:hypothetical protein
MRKKVIMERMVEMGKDDHSFDLEFWRKIGPYGRFSAAWEMINEFRKIRGLHGNQPRLQRSVQTIQSI